MLNENSQLLQTIQEYQNKGKAQECVQLVFSLFSFAFYIILFTI